MSDLRKLRTSTGDWIAPEELRDMLAEEGYSATDRKQFLSALLTEISSESVDGSESEGGQKALRNEVRAILEQEQAKNDNVPIAKDSL